MKQICAFALSGLIAVALPAFMASCSNDDEGREGSGTTDASTFLPGISEAGGHKLAYRVTGVGTVKYSYNAEGELKRIDNSAKQPGESFVVTKKNPFTIEYRMGETSKGVYSNIRLNERGCVTNYDFKWEDRLGGTGIVESYSCVIVYDGGRISRVNTNYSKKGNENGVSYTESEHSYFVFGWEDGNLVRVDGSSTFAGTFGGEKKSKEEMVTHKITYGKLKNRYGQMPYSFGEFIMGKPLCGTLACSMTPLGYFGAGPALLPSKVESRHWGTENGKGFDEETPAEYGYTQNKNGLIATETSGKGGEKCAYAYMDATKE